MTPREMFIAIMSEALATLTDDDVTFDREVLSAVLRPAGRAEHISIRLPGPRCAHKQHAFHRHLRWAHRAHEQDYIDACLAPRPDVLTEDDLTEDEAAVARGRHWQKHGVQGW